MSYGGFYGGGIQPPTVTPEPTGHPNELVRRNPEDTGYTYLSVEELLVMLGSVSSVFGRTGVVVANAADYAGIYANFVHNHDLVYAPISHSHPESDVTNLVSDLAGKAATVHTHTASQTTDFAEAVDDRVNALLVAGGGVTLSYNDVANTMTIGAPAVGLSDGDKGDITVSASGATWTVDNNVVTNAKLADVPTATFKGRTTAATGDPEDLTVAQAKTLLNLTGTNSGDQTITLTSDVTGSGVGSFATTIANNAVTNAKLADVATQTIKGRTTAATGDPEDLTPTQVRTMLGVREVLTAARTYYVRTDGSDSNTGLVDSAGGAFLTIQKAADVAADTLDFAGFVVTVQVKDGTFTGAVTITGPFVGASTASSFVIQGNSGTPSNVLISTTNADAFVVAAGARVTIKDLEIRTATLGYGIYCQHNGSEVLYGNIVFGVVVDFHLFAYGGEIRCVSNYSITGGAIRHIFVKERGLVRIESKTITVTGTPAFSTAFVDAQSCGQVSASAATFSGAATGKRYTSTLNAVINTFGGGINVFPGSIAGTTATGGQYA